MHGLCELLYVWKCLQYQSGLIRIALVLPRESRQRTDGRWTVRSRVKSDQIRRRMNTHLTQDSRSGNTPEISGMNSAFDAKISSAVRTSSVEECACAIGNMCNRKLNKADCKHCTVLFVFALKEPSFKFHPDLQ